MRNSFIHPLTLISFYSGAGDDKGDGFNPELVRMVYRTDWDSTKELIKFTDGYIPTTGVSLDNNAHFILVIKQIQFNRNKTTKILDYGFSILPAFLEGIYCYTGVYQLPIFKGDITQDTAAELLKGNPYSTILELTQKTNKLTGKKMVEVMDKSSLLVRLKDNIFDQLFERPFDLTRMDYHFMPSAFLKKLRYDYEKEERIENLKGTIGEKYLPKGMVPEQWNEVLKVTVNEAYQMNLENEDDDHQSDDSL